MSRKVAQNDPQTPGLEVYPPGETEDEAENAGVPAKRAPQLRTHYDLCQFQARLIREDYRGELDSDKAARLTFMLNSLRQSLTTAYAETILYFVQLKQHELEQQVIKQIDVRGEAVMTPGVQEYLRVLKQKAEEAKRILRI